MDSLQKKFFFIKNVVWRDQVHCSETTQYYYVRKYEQPQRTSASFILVFAGHYPLSYYMPEEMEHEVYSQSMNRYGGRTEKCRSSDSLYFRQDTYKEYFDERLSVQYYYVREEDVAMFDRIMEEIQITPLPDHVLSPHCTDAGQGEQIEFVKEHENQRKTYHRLKRWRQRRQARKIERQER